MKHFWKIYFWMYLLLIVAGYTMAISYFGFSKIKLDILDYTQTGLQLLALIGLYGFVFSKPFGWPVFWKILCVLYIGTDVAYSAYMSLSDWQIVPQEYKTPWFYALMTGATLLGQLIVLPKWFALYRYGFQCREIWARNGL